MADSKGGMAMLAESFVKGIIGEDNIKQMVASFEGMRQLAQNIDARLGRIECELTNISDRIGRLEKAAHLPPIGERAIEETKANGQLEI